MKLHSCVAYYICYFYPLINTLHHSIRIIESEFYDSFIVLLQFLESYFWIRNIFKNKNEKNDF